MSKDLRVLRKKTVITMEDQYPIEIFHDFDVWNIGTPLTECVLGQDTDELRLESYHLCIRASASDPEWAEEHLKEFTEEFNRCKKEGEEIIWSWL